MPISWLSLWLPIILASIAVFFASSFIHMVLKYHKTDFRGVANEDAILDAVRAQNLAPGQYAVPHAGEPARMKDPDFIDKWKRGPVFLTVFPGGNMSLGPMLAQWFVYIIVVSITAAYIGSCALPTGANYLDVFQVTGATSFFGYSLALWQESIWYKKPWSTTIKNTIDGLIYALITAGFFGWMWPR
jgi:hypothetical protein